MAAGKSGFAANRDAVNQSFAVQTRTLSELCMSGNGSVSKLTLHSP